MANSKSVSPREGVVTASEEDETTSESGVRGAFANLSLHSNDERIAARLAGLRFQASQQSCPPTYTLVGFDGSFVDRRDITFVEPLPTSWVCARCGRVPPYVLELPCGHAMCVSCRVKHLFPFPRGGVCPHDGLRFRDCDFEVRNYGLEYLPHLQVYCVHARLGCPFRSELSRLEVHYDECRFNSETCNLR